MRYKFYREHKYLSFALNDLERLIAKTDFRKNAEIATVKKEFNDVVHLLKGHAHYEDTCLHVLLKNKNSTVYDHIQEDHDQLDETLDSLQNSLTAILACTTDEERIQAGDQFYLAYRKFVGENLLHLHEEETVILPELQRLYSDEELKKVEAATYKKMTAEELIEMLMILFPHMNPTDHEAFLQDIQECEPEKFKQVWDTIGHTLAKHEHSKR